MTRAAKLVGARADGPSLDDFAAADSMIGPLGCTRLFYPTQLPPSFAGTVADQLPAGVIPIVSYKTPGLNVTSYVASVTRRTWLVYHHEPEGGDFTSGAEFVAQFAAQSNLIRSVGNPHVLVVMTAGGWQYHTGKNGADGTYLPDPHYVDRYTVDMYQKYPGNWPSQGLANFDQFQNWRNLVQPRGKPFGFTEYGLDPGDYTAGGGFAKRAARLQQDASYLGSEFGGNLLIWEYWWHDNGTNLWRFTDSATIKIWRSIAKAANPF